MCRNNRFDDARAGKIGMSDTADDPDDEEMTVEEIVAICEMAGDILRMEELLRVLRDMEVRGYGGTVH